jgi:hypothetical protein
LSGGATLTVRDTSDASFNSIELASVDIQSADNVIFGGNISATGNITVLASETITLSSPVTTASNLTFTTNRFDLGSNITVQGYGSNGASYGYQTFNGEINLTSNVTLTGNIFDLTGGITSNDYSSTFRFNERPVFPPFDSASQSTQSVNRLSPSTQSVELIESLDQMQRVLNVADVYEATPSSTDNKVFSFGEGFVLELSDDPTCLASCDSDSPDDFLELSNVEDYTIVPSAQPLASLVRSIGEISRTLGPKIIPIF